MNFGMGAMKRMRKIIATLPPLHPSEHSFHLLLNLLTFSPKQKKTSRIAAQENGKIFSTTNSGFQNSSLQTQNTFRSFSNLLQDQMTNFENNNK
jgi:hypothetical protein